MRVSAAITGLLICVCSCLAATPARIETASAPSEIRLDNGTDLFWSGRSAGTVYSDHLVLDEGAVRVKNFKDYSIDARDLHIRTAEPGTAAVVRLNGQTIEVASLGGALNVSDGGAMLTRVAAGTRVSFRHGSNSSRGDRHVMLWIIVITAAAALAIGLTAAAQGKSL